jgi:hypothetical protein
MSFDIIGQRPSTQKGKCFSTNGASWSPLALYIQRIAPELASQCTYWYTNDGDGLDAEHAAALADRLDVEIREGRCERYLRLFKSEQEMEPDEACHTCNGTGCRRCDEKGMVRPLWTLSPCSVEIVKNFVIFLRACGGFSIL